MVVFGDPGIEVGLQLVDGAIDLLAKRDAIEFVKHGAVEALADAVGLRALGLGAGVVDILHRQVEFVFVPLRLPQYSVPRSVSTRLRRMPCSSKNGSTRSLSRSAAVIGVLRS